MDLHFGRWIRDFVLLGTGIGLLAPTVMLGPMAWGGQTGLLLLLILTSAGGAGMGVLVGLVMFAIASAGRHRPLALIFAGVPVGALAGLGVGFCVGSLLDTKDMPTVVGTLGFLVGGPVLGFTWLPYLALKHIGRSGLPAVAMGVLSSPIMGVLALISAALVFNL